MLRSFVSKGIAHPCSRLIVKRRKWRPSNVHVRSPTVRHSHRPTDDKQTSVGVYFKTQDVLVDASPGENILTVAHRFGVNIPTGCLSGSCGTCEVEVTTEDGRTFVARSCIASLPEKGSVAIDDVTDQVWGVDGMDL